VPTWATRQDGQRHRRAAKQEGVALAAKPPT